MHAPDNEISCVWRLLRGCYIGLEGETHDLAVSAYTVRLAQWRGFLRKTKVRLSQKSVIRGDVQYGTAWIITLFDALRCDADSVAGIVCIQHLYCVLHGLRLY